MAPHTPTPHRISDGTSLGAPTPAPDAPEQLLLLLPSERPLQFRLDRRTRELGLAQIAIIRRQLAQRAMQMSA